MHRPALALLALALLALALLAVLTAAPAAAQPEEWSRPFPAHRVIGNLYAVGTYGLGCFLVTSGEGHILINTGLVDSAPLIRENVESLSFRLEDVRIRLTVIESPGHTRGSASYTMTVAENGRDYRVAIANMGSMNPGLRLVKDPTYPGIAEGFAETFRRQKAMEVDVWVAAHGPQYGLHDKHRPSDPYDPTRSWIPEGFRKLVAHYEALYEQQLAAERRVSRVRHGFERRPDGP